MQSLCIYIGRLLSARARCLFYLKRIQQRPQKATFPRRHALRLASWHGLAWLLTVSKNGSPLSTFTVVVMVISYPFLEKAMRISQKAFIARVNRKIAEQDLKLRVASR